MAPRRLAQRADASTKPLPSSSTSTTDPPAVPSKRKSSDEHDAQQDQGYPTRKKAKQTKTTKSKVSAGSKPVNGEQVAGGLFIVRGAPAGYPSMPLPDVPVQHLPPIPPPPERRPARRSSPPPPREPTGRKTSAAKKPAARSSRAAPSSSAPASAPVPVKSAKAKGKERQVEPEEVPDEIRTMVQELSDLTMLGREQARRAGPPTPQHSDLTFAPRKSYSLPPPPSPSSYHPPPAPSHAFLEASSSDSVQPLPIRDTPMISKNREMRKEAQDRRRSSWGMRGRRSSGAPNDYGEISHPHPSLPHTTFYKHMSPEDPPALRMRNLLMWCSSRASQPSTVSPPRQGPRRAKDKRPPPPDSLLAALSPEADKLLKDSQEEILRLLATSQIDTSVFARGGHDGPVGEGGKKLRANEQNVRNRQREEADLAYIERCKEEDSAWSSLIQSYNAHQASVVKAITVQTGKRLAETSWRPRLNELDDRWLAMAEAAETEMRYDFDQEDRTFQQRFATMELKVDSLHHSTHVLSQLADRSATHLASHLVTLQSRHQARSAPLPPLTAPSSLASAHPSAPLSALLSAIRPDARSTTAGGQDDPHLLFRALASKDVDRQRREEEGDTDAQRRREGVADRRVTAVPPTPRRGPGTPGRRSTPGRSKG